MPEPLLFPEFLYGEQTPTRRKMKAETKKWGKRYAKSGDFPEPKLMPVPPGSIVVWQRYALEFMKGGMSTENDPEWAKVCSRAGPHVPRWHLYHLDDFMYEIPTVEERYEVRHLMYNVYETFVQRYPWGALVIAIGRPHFNTIPVVTRRVDALLSFWEPLDTIRYLSYDLYPVSLTDFVRRLYQETLVTWVDHPTGNMKADLRTAITNMLKASEDEIHARILRSAHWLIDTWTDVKHRDWLKSPGLLERELERVRREDPEGYAELAGSGGSGFVGPLERAGPEGAQP